jgi:hypothetical protein
MEVRRCLDIDPTEPVRKTTGSIHVEKITEKRMRACVEMGRKATDDWKADQMMIFRDEASIIEDLPRHGVWRARGQTGVGTYPKEQHGMRIMIFGP